MKKVIATAAALACFAVGCGLGKCIGPEYSALPGVPGAPMTQIFLSAAPYMGSLVYGDPGYEVAYYSEAAIWIMN